MNDTLTHVPTELEIATGPDMRLLLRIWTAASGRQMITIAPQLLGRAGEWRLQHSGLIVAPNVARELAPALLAMAATVDGTPSDPEPSAEDREGSRWP